ncbi:unnamed protein product [Mycena citricolor]|uniref:Uncharacterized protein n=1 Tax=Mycena citricolor TaxID=2018698 RepID=A0AAD2JWQ8_9AGAR|nr:unnamed protein product [Mycena citricolor]
MSLDEKVHDAHERDDSLVEAPGTQTGVLRVEAIQAVWGTTSKIVLFISIALASYMYILDNGTNWAWASYASIQFGHYQQFAAIQCAMAILLAIGKPLFAKLTDAAGRAEVSASSRALHPRLTTPLGHRRAHVSMLRCQRQLTDPQLALFFYVLGYVVDAATPTMAGLGAGLCIWELGFSGLQIALQIVIADVVTLRWRPIVSGLSTGGWYFINFYANGQITSRLTAAGGPGWRWGYGIYAICYLPALLPIIFTLMWAQRRAKAQGLIPKQEPRPFKTTVHNFCSEVDFVGLFLLAASLALVFLPIVLAGGAYATTTWHNPAVPAMMVIGGAVTFPAFVFWEARMAQHPVIPWRVLGNRTVLAGCAINFFDFISFYLSYNELYGFVSATTRWDIGNLVYFTNAQSLCLTFFGLGWAVFAGIFKTGYRRALIAALAIRLLGIGIMFYARSHQSTGALVMTQIIQGMGGGIAAFASQIGAQGAVPHQDVALATAALLLSAELGNVVGTAAAGAIWNNRLPAEIAKYVPALNSTQIAGFVGSPTLVRGLTGQEYTAMVSAYSATMHTLLIPAIVFAVFPLLASFFVQDFRLLDIQNAVEVKRLDGRKAADADPSIAPAVLEEKV